jgi:hypothetical protein
MKAKTTIALSVLTLLIHFSFGQFSASSTLAGTITTNSVPQGTDWTTPSNVQSGDNVFATCLITGSNKPSYYLDATNWGFQSSNNLLPNYVPSGATINGIEVFIKLKKTGIGKIRDNKIILLRAGAEAGTTKARSAVLWPTSNTEIRFGSNIDLWGTTWTATDLVNTGFGVRISARNRGSKDAQAEIDYVRINLYFNQVFYYSKAAGNLELTTTWGTNTDGSGTQPLNFTNGGQIFFVQNRAATSLTNSMTVSGIASKMVVGNGAAATTLTIPAAYSLTSTVDVANGSSLTITNTTSPTIGAIADNTTVTYNAAGNQTIQEATYYNLTASGSGTKSVSSLIGTIAVNNVLTIASGVIVDNQGNNVFVYGGTSGISNNGTATGTGRYIYSLIDANTNITGTGVYSNLEVEFSTTGGTRSLSVMNPTSITGTLLLTDGTCANGANLTMQPASTIELTDGTLGSTIATSTGYDVIYDPYTTSSPKGTTNEISGGVRNFTVQSGTGLAVNLDRNLNLSGDLTLTSGSLDPTNTNYNVALGGNYTNNATMVQRNNTVTFNGTSAQSIIAPATQTFYNLVINNSGNDITLNAGIGINNQLTLTNGFISSTLPNITTMTSAATVGGGSTNSFVKGPFQWTVAATSATKTFPIGKGGDYRPVVLTINQVSAASTVYTAEMFNSAPPSRTLPPDLSAVSSVRYYTISSSNNANLSDATVLINYTGDDNVVDPTTLRIAKSSGSNWINIGGVGTAAGTGTITSGTFTSFSDFVLGTYMIPLPLKWISFTGQLKNKTVELKWQTANEVNVSHFEIEHSTDGINWTPITSINAINGATNSYSYTDLMPSAVNFYRVKEVDIDGRVSVSKTIMIRLTNNSGIAVYPNPIVNKTVNLYIMDPLMIQSGKIQVRIYDISGQLRYSTLESASYNLQINVEKLSTGNYFLVVGSGANQQKTNFQVQ